MIIQEDAHTGIQRVVRALLLQMMSDIPVGYAVYPIYCTNHDGYRYAEKSLIAKFCKECQIPTGEVIINNKDIFFGLDFSPKLITQNLEILIQWKCMGVKIHIIVYDLLPHLHPEWFTPRGVYNFNLWLDTISVVSDSLVCISETVKSDLRLWCIEQGFSNLIPKIKVISLGAEINATAPTTGFDDASEQTLYQLANRTFILMVGTIEPRKGYLDVIHAMESLWLSDENISLVIVGKPGWKTKKLQQKIHTHPQYSERLFWLKNVSDETLEKLYNASYGLVMASYGEGFGLPIVEAMAYKKPVLARDIPIFREIGNGYPTYFSQTENRGLEKEISEWLKKSHRNSNDGDNEHCWHSSVRSLYKNLGLQ